ncbi:hypothetical protein BDW62DRAFT_181180 [Aspergillus aurantiobrunneus]
MTKLPFICSPCICPPTRTALQSTDLVTWIICTSFVYAMRAELQQGQGYQIVDMNLAKRVPNCVIQIGAIGRVGFGCFTQ